MKLFFIPDWLVKLISKPTKEDTTARDAEQDAKNREFVAKIIDGDTRCSLETTKTSSKLAFALWQTIQKGLFLNATSEMLKERNRCIKESRYYYPGSVDTYEKWQYPPNNLYAENLFTEPFPSLHDMDDWALYTQFSDLMILKGISRENAAKHTIVIKNHFVNHDMVRGIIQFDVVGPEK